MASLTIAPLHPSLGAEVAGVDLSNGLDGHADTREEDRAKYGRPVEHPMIRTHPVHGSRAVYFHISKATHVSGMTPGASKRYLRDLARSPDRPGYRVPPPLAPGRRARHRQSHHHAPAITIERRARILWRIIVEGDRPRLV